MKASLFDYNNYKKYLNEVLEFRAKSEKGQKSKLAEAMACQAAYLSQVLNGSAELSPEQALAASNFLSHTDFEGRYLLNLVLLARAGTKELKSFYQTEIKKQLNERSHLKNRISQGRTMKENEVSQFASAWYYPAIHAIVGLEGYNTSQTIAKALNISEKLTKQALELLVQVGMIESQAKGYRRTGTDLFIEPSSVFLQRFHSNLRMKALQMMELSNPNDYRYSSYLIMGKEDIPKMKEIMIEAINKMKKLAADSKDEILAAYTSDFFTLLEIE